MTTERKGTEFDRNQYKAFDAIIGALGDWVPDQLITRVSVRVVEALDAAGVDLVERPERTECRGSATGLHFFPEAECTRCGATS